MFDCKIELPEGVPLLAQYYIYLTAGCNLACRHCWLTPMFQPDGSTGGHLDFELFKLAIDEGRPLGLKNVKLTGGEPLLHPDFMRMIDYLREKDVRLTIETNGTLLTPEIARYLKDKSTLDHIAISMDGATAEIHDAFRGVLGSFTRANFGLRNLVKVGFHPQIIMSLHSGNIDEIEALVRMAESSGVGSVKFNLIQPTGRGETMTEQGQSLNIRKLIELGKWVEKDLQKRSSVFLHFSWPMAFYGLKQLMNHGSGSCGIFNVLGILSTGQMAMCGIGMEIPELLYGKLGIDRVADIWQYAPTLQALRQDLPAKLEGICANCIMKLRCLGSCVACNYHDAHRLTAPFWFCQQAYEKELFPSSRLHQFDSPTKSSGLGLRPSIEKTSS